MSEKVEAQTLKLTKKGLETRNKLLRAAEKVFSEKGFYEASIVNITQEANVANGTYYNYFATKKEIFDELIRDYNRNLRHAIKKEMEKATSHEDAQRRGFKAFFDWAKTRPDLYNIVQQAVVVDQELYRWYYQKIAAGFVKSLTRGINDGEFKPLDLETVAYSLMSIGQFLGMRWIYWEGKDVPEEAFEAAMTLIFDGLKQKDEG